jgi:hypothetical protein
MPEYRFYRVDQHGQSWGAPELAECIGDEEAIAHARKILTGYVIEVRQADRAVTRVEPGI